MLFFAPQIHSHFKPTAHCARFVLHKPRDGLVFIVFNMISPFDYLCLAANVLTDSTYDMNMGRISINRRGPQMAVGIIDQHKLTTQIVTGITEFDERVKSRILEFKAGFRSPAWFDSRDTSFDQFVLDCSTWISSQDDLMDDLIATVQYEAVQFRKKYLRKTEISLLDVMGKQ